MMREEILAVYRIGPEAVIRLVAMLFETNQGLSSEVAGLKERIKILEDRLALNSQNSNKPPSSDGFIKPHSQRKKSGRKAGGQKGHAGHTLKMADKPDHIVSHAVERCAGCECDMKKEPVIGQDRRQVFDVPPTKIEVTEHRSEKKVCPHCGRLNKAPFPENIDQPVQYGNRIKSLAVYFNQYHCLPYERSSEIFFDLFGVAISQATLVNANQACFEAMLPVSEKIKEQIISSPVVHFDETGCSIDGQLEWLHVASTHNLTYYEAHRKRGGQATADIGILPRYQGIAVHDFWRSYFLYLCRHALCNAHHLRELTAVYELDQQQWAKQLIDLLLDIKMAVDEQKPLADHLPPLQTKNFEKRYDRIIAAGLAANPPPPALEKPLKRGRPKQSKAKNLLVRLREHRREVLAFMYDFRVPFDNNQAERDIRMTKVKQKISGTFRSRDGAAAFCRIRGYISTVKKNSLSVIDAIQSVFDGNPVYPVAAT